MWVGSAALPATGTNTVVLAVFGTALIIGGAAAIRGSRRVAEPNPPEARVKEGSMDPNVIESRDFFITVRGYDRSEVRSFLKEVASYCRRLEMGPSPAERPAEATVAPFQALGTHVASVLEAAERSADAIVKQAEEQAQGLVADAKVEAQRARHDEEQRLEAVRRELEARERDLERVTEEAKQHAADLERMTEARRAEATALAEKIISDARDAAAASYTRRDAAREELARLLDRLRNDLDPSPPLIDLRDERKVGPDTRVD